jgi:hypothetical protein
MEDRRFGTKVASAATHKAGRNSFRPASCHQIEDGRSGRKPLLPKRVFVGAASAATPCVIEKQGSGLPESPSPRPSCHRRRMFGAKAPPTEARFCRSGFRRDLRVIENRRFGSKDRGAFSPMIADGMEGNCPQLLGLDRRAQREGRGWPLLLSDRSRTWAKAKAPPAVVG